VSNGAREADKLREMVVEEGAPNPDRQLADTTAYEITNQRPGEYVFVLGYVGRLTAIVGNCIVSISPTPELVPLGELSAPALDIGRTVGCSPYINDFEPPTFDTTHDQPRWTTADGLVYDPRTPPEA
jgi:hypothetical protein